MAKKYEVFQLAKCSKPLQAEALKYLGVNWKPKHYLSSPHCKVCRLPVRPEVEEFLYSGAPYDFITSWLKQIGYETINPSDISKHYKAHCNIEREIEERGMVRMVSEIRKREAQGLAKLSGSEVLQGILEIFVEKFDPDVTPIRASDAIKAVRTQHEMKAGRPDGDPILRLYETLAENNLKMTVEPAPDKPAAERECEEGEVEEDDISDERQARIALPGTGA